VAVPFTNLNRLRTRLYHETKNKGYELVSYISSKAFVWRNATVGENCFIFENNVIQHHVNNGNNVILWSGNHVGHRSVIKDNCFISSHVVIAGNCEIGENCFIGVNSTFNDELKVGKDCFISSGTLVIKNALEGKIYKGSPAKASSVDVYRYFNIERESLFCNLISIIQLVLVQKVIFCSLKSEVLPFSMGILGFKREHLQIV